MLQWMSKKPSQHLVYYCSISFERGFGIWVRGIPLKLFLTLLNMYYLSGDVHNIVAVYPSLVYLNS